VFFFFFYKNLLKKGAKIYGIAKMGCTIFNGNLVLPPVLVVSFFYCWAH